MFRMRLVVPAIAAFAFALAGCATAPAPAPTPPPPAPLSLPAPPPPMSPQAIAAHIKILASDEFEGRAPASEGEKKTLAYLEKQFRDIGLEQGPTGYLQPVPLAESIVQGSPALTVTGKDGAKTYAFRDNWVAFTRRFATKTDVKNADLVFVGYGVTAPDAGWSDYAKANIKGKIAVILINDPDFETSKDLTGPFGGKAMTYYGRWTYKYEEAQRQGAIGALIVHETAPAAYPWAVVQSSWTRPQYDMISADKGASEMEFQAWLSTSTAADLFKRAGLDFAKLKAAAQKPGFKAVPMKLKGSASLDLAIKDVTSANVLGVVKGTKRPDEVVLYTAHWDHLGRCPAVDGDDICNGALDNASGTATLIEIARAFATGPKPERTVAFLAVTAEEKGLLGSAYYAANPLFPLSKTVANINMDGMSGFGRTKDVEVVGYGKNEVEDILAKHVAKQGREIKPEAFPERGGYFRSDQFSLAKVGVPAIFASGGLDLVNGGVERGVQLDEAFIANAYHKPGDEFSDAWDLSGAAEDSQLLFAVGADIANSGVWPAWKSGAEFKAIRETSLKSGK
jgi:Zn-dependent M28 family amino/carboxypeptidase